jgi:uncharacterized membrane protein
VNATLRFALTFEEIPMSHRLLTLVAVIVGFGAVTAMALLDVGYFGILEPHFRSWGAAQVFVDLVILAVLACVWMVNDARDRGLSAWPFIAVTLIAGSFGPLLYLVVRELRATARTNSIRSAGAAR